MDKQEDIEILSEDEKQEFLSDVFFRFCPNCGKEIIQKPQGRQKLFCSDKCRLKWKGKHPNFKNWKSTRVVICPVCGKSFFAYGEYSKHKRKYCSRACANKARALKKGRENVEK